jgi:hypothetical protein
MRRKPIIPKLTTHLLDDPDCRPLHFTWRNLTFWRDPHSATAWHAKCGRFAVHLCGPVNFPTSEQSWSATATLKSDTIVSGWKRSPRGALAALRRNLSHWERIGVEADHALWHIG